MPKHHGLTMLAIAVLIGASLLEPSMAHAYVGPSAAIGFFSAAFGLVFALLSAIFVVLLWPMRMLVRKIKLLFAKNSEHTAVAGETR